MKRLNYQITIESPASKVYDIMLGLSDASSYNEWTTLFNPTSAFEGTWEKGSKILFTGLDDKGNKGGMVSRILENDPNRYVSIQHNGMLVSGKEITEGPDVESWAGGLENYRFEENNGATIVTIEIDSQEEYQGYMDDIYPKALAKLKEICER